MNILFLAPEPFFQERGTPIAIKLALQVLSKRKGTKVKVICYNEGTEENFEGVEIKRISKSGKVCANGLSRHRGKNFSTLYTGTITLIFGLACIISLF